MVVAKRYSPLVTGVVPRDDVRAFLEQSVVPRYWPGARLLGCQIARSRFTPGEECAAIATLTLDPVPSVQPKVVVTFARRKDLDEALRTYELGPLAFELAAEAPDGQPSVLDAEWQPVYSADLQCIAELFPNDWCMPGLRTALSAEAMLPVVLRAAGRFPGSGASLDVRLLRHRPHSRSVVLYTARDAQGRIVAEAVGKLFRSEGKAKRMWKLLEAVAARSTPAPLVPAPLQRMKESAFLLMSKLPGRSLLALLENPGDADLPQLMHVAAGTLRTFHAIDASDFKKRKISKDIEDCEEALENSEAGRAHDFEALALVEALQCRAGELPKPPSLALVHGAFKPSALLVDGERASLVDLDACAAGDPARDVACFTAKLRTMALTDGQSHLEALAGDFLRAYSPDASAREFERRVEFYEAVFLTETGLKHLNTSWRGESDATPGYQLLRLARERLQLSYV